MIRVVIAAHAAGVGAGVSVVGAFVVLHGGHVAKGFSVAETEQRKFFTFEFFFDDEGVALSVEFDAEGKTVGE